MVVVVVVDVRFGAAVYTQKRNGCQRVHVLVHAHERVHEHVLGRNSSKLLDFPM